MFVKIKDDVGDDLYKVSVYEKENSRIYTEDEIKIKDNINVDFISLNISNSFSNIIFHLL